MSRNYTNALFPLALLAGLAALTFWLSYAIQLPNEDTEGKHRHDPDYFIEHFSLRKLDPQGILHYSLTAQNMLHFPDDDSTIASQPKLIYTRPNRPLLTINADRATVNSDASEVRLYDHVRIHREASADQEAMTGTAPDLLLLPDEERARTASPVHIVQGRSQLDGTGLEIDNAARTFALHSRVTGQFDSRHRKGN